MNVFHWVFLLTFLVTLSTVINIFLWFKTRKKQSAGVQETLDATELLSRLLHGGRAVVVVDVLNPAELFMYSPKTMKPTDD
jgi:hypothetical protein